MSLVTSLDFIDDLEHSTSSGANITITNNDSTISGINTIKYKANSQNISETTVTYILKASKLNDYIFSNTDIINLKFDIYVNFFNAAADYFNIEINDNNVFYHEGNPTVSNKKFTINYLFKSSELNSILSNTNPTMKIIFVGLDGSQSEYVLLDRNFELYAIYKPEFSSITGSLLDTTSIDFNDSYNASSQIIANANACEIKGPAAFTSSGNVTFNLKDKLLNGYPVSLFFNLNLKNLNPNSGSSDSFKIQIDKDDGIGFVDYLNLTSDDNDTLKTFFYSQTENYNSTNDFKIRFNLYNPDESSSIGGGDYVFFDDMITYIPEAINFFDGDVSVNGDIDVTGLIYKTGMIGEIGMFYEESQAPPFGYLWCDGSQITTNSSTSGGDDKYRNLIEVLQGVNKNSTTGTQSAYLPNFTDCYALGSTNTFQSYSNVNNAISNKSGTSDLDINYFPSHNHSLNNINYTNNITSFDSNITINNNSYTQNTISYTETDNSKQAGKSGGNNASKNIMRLTTHTHNLTKANNYNTEFHYNININYDNNQLSKNDISVQSYDTNNTINVQPLSYKLKAAICYL